MPLRCTFLLSAVAVFSAGLASAQSDECNTAIALTLGAPTPFSTIGATTSFPWPCTGGGIDIWYQVLATADGGLTLDVCGSSFDTALEAFTGSCAALVSLSCNDDSCGLQSSISFTAVAGTTYTVRVGGVSSSSGAGVITATLTPPLSNDECSTALAVQNGVPTTFDTIGSTTSLPWPCAGGGSDIWFSYVALTSGVSLRVETCGSTFDTALEVFDGTCGALNSLGCNDDRCGLQSQIKILNFVAGTTYFIRVGGFSAHTGAGTLLVLEGQPPVQGCVVNPGLETSDLTGWSVLDHPTPFLPLQVVGAGQTPGFGLFVSAPTEGNFALVHGFDGGGPGVIRMSQDVTVSSGLTPLSFDYRAGWDMVSFPGSTLDRTFDVVVIDPTTLAVLQTSRILTAQAVTSTLDTGPLTGNVNLTPFLGQTVRVSFDWTIPESFTGPGFFQLDNISCPSGGGGIGSSYCTANVNSTGVTGVISGSGSASIAANNLSLEAMNLPLNVFGYFITSLTQAVIPNPGGSQGILCLGGQIGRYTGMGQIQDSGATGSYTLLLDLAQVPTPMGFVAAAVGETRHFQSWHRDSAGGVATSNFTNGLSVTFN